MSSIHVVKLPINFNTPFKTRINQAQPLSAMLSRRENIFPSLYNYFYTLTYSAADNSVGVDPLDFWFPSDYFTRLTTAMPYDVLNLNTIIDIIEKMLKLNYYCVGDFNIKYISGIESFQKNNFNNRFMLFGYDRKHQLLSSCGLDYNGDLKEIEIKIDDFYQAVINSDLEKLFLHFFLFDSSLQPNIFDYSKFYREIDIYINSNEPDSGRGVAYKLIDDLQINEGKNINICKRNITAFCECAEFMNERLKYLSSSSVHFSNAADEYYKITLSTKKLRGMFFSCKVWDKRTTGEIVNLINGISESQLEVFNKISRSLKLSSKSK